MVWDNIVLRGEIKDTILMGADYYERFVDDPRETIPIGIGKNSSITGAIIDKNARIGENVTICPFPPGTEIDGKSWSVRDGIVVIPKNVTIYSGTYIGPDKDNA